MENKLPKNWIETDLDTVILRMTNGSSLKQEEEPFEGSLPISRIETIWNETIDLDRVKYVDASEEDIEKYGLQKGDVLFSHINSDKHLGKTAVFNLEETLIHGINLLLLRAMPQFNGDLLNYILRHYRFSGKFIEVAQRSVNQSSINQKKLKSFVVPLPPLAEQQRIVAKLDDLFGHLDNLKTRLNNIPQILKNFRQAVLTQAVTGKLTEEWRVGKDLEEWKETTIGKLFTVKTGATPKRGNTSYYERGKIPWLKSGQVKNEYIYEAEEYITDLAVKETNAKLYPKDTLLVAMYGEGKTRGQVGWMKLEAASNQAIAALVNEEMDIKSKQYVYYYCLSQYLEIRKQAEGGNQPNLNLSKIKNWKISVPSIEEQTEIVKRVEHLFTKADTIEAQYQNLKTKIDSLPQAILAKAFKGELVAQLESDGSAAVLLEEIQNIKASLRGTKQSVKGKRKKRTLNT